MVQYDSIDSDLKRERNNILKHIYLWVEVVVPYVDDLDDDAGGEAAAAAAFNEDANGEDDVMNSSNEGYVGFQRRASLLQRPS